MGVHFCGTASAIFAQSMSGDGIIFKERSLDVMIETSLGKMIGQRSMCVHPIRLPGYTHTERDPGRQARGVVWRFI